MRTFHPVVQGGARLGPRGSAKRLHVSSCLAAGGWPAWCSWTGFKQSRYRERTAQSDSASSGDRNQIVRMSAAVPGVKKIKKVTKTTTKKGDGGETMVETVTRVTSETTGSGLGDNIINDSFVRNVNGRWARRHDIFISFYNNMQPVTLIYLLPLKDSVDCSQIRWSSSLNTCVISPAEKSRLYLIDINMYPTFTKFTISEFWSLWNLNLLDDMGLMFMI